MSKTEIVVELEDGTLEKATRAELEDYARAFRLRPSARVWIDGAPTSLEDYARTRKRAARENALPVWFYNAMFCVAGFVAALLVCVVAAIAFGSKKPPNESRAPETRVATSERGVDASEDVRARETSAPSEDGEDAPKEARDDAAPIETSENAPTEEPEIELTVERAEDEERAEEEKVEVSGEEDDESAEKEDDESVAEDKTEDASEKKPAPVYIPDDFETLAEALDFVADDGEIVIKARKKPYLLGQSDLFRPNDARRGALSTKRAVVRSERRDPADVAIEIDDVECLYVEGDKTIGTVQFIGLTFKRARRSRPLDDFSASLRVESGGAEFRRCRFKGVRESSAVGVYVLSAFATAKFVDCEFVDSGRAGLWVGEDSEASVVNSTFCSRGDYCVYIERNAVFNAASSLFSGARLGVYAQTGVRGKVEGCVFEANEVNWSTDDQWRDAQIIFINNRD